MSDSLQQVARFERYVELDPHNATLWVGYGDALHSAGLLDRAEQAFRKSAQLEPNSAIPKARLAAVEISRQNFATAERLLRELIDGGERDPALAFNLGLCLYYQRRFADAVETFEPLTATIPDARYYLVSCLHNLARLDDALDRAQRFLAERSSAKLRGYTALVQMDSGRMQDALANARHVLAEQPDNADAAAVLSTHHLENQDIDLAQQHLNVLLSKESRNVRAWQGLALVALHRQDHEDAARLLHRARECDPENTGTISTLAWVRIAQHRFEESERVSREGLAIDRNDAELHGALATALVFQRRFDAAKQEVGLAFGLDRHCFGAAFAQSIMLKLQGRDELSARLFGDVLRSSPRDGGQSVLDGLVTYWKRHPPTSRDSASGDATEGRE
jgi:Flp pilus assembly protein TadD